MMADRPHEPVRPFRKRGSPAHPEVPTSLQSWPPTRREISPALASLGLDRQMSRQWKWCKARGREAETEILRGLLEKYVDALVLFVLEGKDGDELVTPPRQTIPITNLKSVEAAFHDGGPRGAHQSPELAPDASGDFPGPRAFARTRPSTLHAAEETN